MKTVFVTGGANGIGKAACLLFYKKGYNVVSFDPDEESSLLLEKEIVQLNQSNIYLYIKGSISNEQEIVNATNVVGQHNLTVNVLINNAGIFNGSGMKATAGEWNSILNTNVVGTFLVTKYLLPYMKSTQSSIINVASISGVIAQPDYLLYSTSKAAIINMTRCMALDLSKKGIKVNSISPSTVWTENNSLYITRDYGVDKEGAGKHPLLGGKQIMNRVSEPEEIANLLYFLGSEESSFITGENIMVDGGYTAL